MVRVTRIGIGSLVLLSTLAVAGRALEQPIDGQRLVFRDRGVVSKNTLTFVATNPDQLLPNAGGYGDPSLTGLSIYIITRGETLHLRIPGEIAGPGWRTRQGRSDSYIFMGSSIGNDDSIKLVLRRGKALKLRIRGLQLTDAFPLGGMGAHVRMALGGACAVFTGTSIQRDGEGVFAAREAPVMALPDCSNSTIAEALIPPIPCELSSIYGDEFGNVCGGICPDDSECAYFGDSCGCVSPHQPCGDSQPACNGECPLGETCFTLNFAHPPPFVACTCSRSDQVPCGAAGGSYCPPGSSCQRVPGHHAGLYPDFWQCIQDGAVCGYPGFGACPGVGLCVRWPPDGWRCF